MQAPKHEINREGRGFIVPIAIQARKTAPPERIDATGGTLSYPNRYLDSHTESNCYSKSDSYPDTHCYSKSYSYSYTRLWRSY